MPKTFSANIPTDGVIIITRRKRRDDNPAQQDCFGGYCSRWMDKMIPFIRSLPRPVRMSEVRRQAGIAGMEAPLAKSWYGKVMQMAGLRLVGYDRSPLKSRRGGIEAKWE
jgi:hypothetical protein